MLMFEKRHRDVTQSLAWKAIAARSGTTLQV